MHGMSCCFDQPCHFFGTQHHRQSLGPLRVHQIIESEIAPLQSFLVEKTQSRHADLDGARGVFLFVEQVELVSAYLLGSEFFWRPAEVLCKLLYGKNVTTGCCLGIVAALEFFQHPLTKLGHRDLLSVTLEANATTLLRLLHATASAATAA